MKRSFTLMEILIVVAILIILSTIGLVALNPKRQIEKTWDSKRKAELSSLKKTLEDWYNDHNRYPINTEICYDGFSSDNTCHLCGSNTTSPDLSPYLSRLPCDPQSPAKEYLYQVDSVTSPTWFRIYTKLFSSAYLDHDIIDVGCSSGCGPGPSYIYNYGVSSPNIDLEGQPACPGDLWCRTYSLPGNCNHCGDLATCITSCGSPLELFSNNDCTQPCHQ